MYYNYYRPYPYYRRYYNINPYYYGRYYNPFYNVVDSQVSDVDQSIINYGDMMDVIQDADVYQSMAPAPEDPVLEENNNIESEIVIIKQKEVKEEEPESETPSLLILP